MLLIKNARLWRWRRPHRHSTWPQQNDASGHSSSSSIMPEGGLVQGWMLVEEAGGAFVDVGYDDDNDDDNGERGTSADRVRSFAQSGSSMSVP